MKISTVVVIAFAVIVLYDLAGISAALRPPLRK